MWITDTESDAGHVHSMFVKIPVDHVVQGTVVEAEIIEHDSALSCGAVSRNALALGLDLPNQLACGRAEVANPVCKIGIVGMCVDPEVPFLRQECVHSIAAL